MTHTEQMLILLSAVAGAIHVLTPDHWLPSSVLSWQRGWRFPRIMGFTLFAFTLHVLAGFGIYFVMFHFVSDIPPANLFSVALILVILGTILRGLRFNRMREVVGVGPRSRWGIFAVLSLLGPCESIIPIFIKARQLGFGYMEPMAAFLLGTFLAGTAAILFTRVAWNLPHWFPRTMNWAHQRMATVPFLAGVALGLSFLMRLSA
ncbi:MAG: hypothetical protein A2428_03500 [Bdellovibrionales bacterium RIFOXYC1_FULL_54_43]|nr:MAG: hypothetical protein A2428_03500 [Bdellovibrionales bacterium RIFOXYC1_FULL_54_43]